MRGYLLLLSTVLCLLCPALSSGSNDVDEDVNEEAGKIAKTSLVHSAFPPLVAAGEEVSVDYTGTIGFRPGCQPIAAPQWSWEVKVMWRAGDVPDAPYTAETPPYKLSLTAPDGGPLAGGPLAHLVFVTEEAGEWQFQVRAKADYQTTCGNGSSTSAE